MNELTFSVPVYEQEEWAAIVREAEGVLAQICPCMGIKLYAPPRLDNASVWYRVTAVVRRYYAVLYGLAIRWSIFAEATPERIADVVFQLAPEFMMFEERDLWLPSLHFVLDVGRVACVIENKRSLHITLPAQEMEEP